MIGDLSDDRPRSPLAQYDSSVNLAIATTFTTVDGRRLPEGTRPEIVQDLGAADRDLAFRLINRPSDAPWWGLHLSGADVSHGGGYGTFHSETEGRLQPILVDGLGDPVVAAWVPPSGDQRWYIIPDGTDLGTVLGWLVQRALPGICAGCTAPGALPALPRSRFADRPRAGRPVGPGRPGSPLRRGK